MPLAMAAWVEANASPDDKSFISLRGESACYNVYRSADGQPLALAAIEPKFWTNFCRAVDKPEWIAQHIERNQQPVPYRLSHGALQNENGRRMGCPAGRSRLLLHAGHIAR